MLRYPAPVREILYHAWLDWVIENEIIRLLLMTRTCSADPRASNDNNRKIASKY